MNPIEVESFCVYVCLSGLQLTLRTPPRRVSFVTQSCERRDEKVTAVLGRGQNNLHVFVESHLKKNL